MLANPYRDGTQEVYWIVGVGLTRRHATAVRPGAQPAGEWIPAVCGVCVRVPFATPHGRLPRSVLVTERCRECGDIVADRGFRARDWDF